MSSQPAAEIRIAGSAKTTRRQEKASMPLLIQHGSDTDARRSNQKRKAESIMLSAAGSSAASRRKIAAASTLGEVEGGAEESGVAAIHRRQRFSHFHCQFISCSSSYIK